MDVLSESCCGGDIDAFAFAAFRANKSIFHCGMLDQDGEDKVGEISAGLADDSERLCLDGSLDLFPGWSSLFKNNE